MQLACQNTGMEYRAIPGYEGLYEVSSDGTVRNRRGRILSTVVTTAGYKTVHLCKECRPQRYLVSRLVALAFLGPPPKPDMQVNHIDANKLNNAVSNLEWVTPQQNTRHAMALGLTPVGERCGRSRLSAAQVRLIRAAPPAVSTNALATIFKVKWSSIENIRTRKTWRHI